MSSRAITPAPIFNNRKRQRQALLAEPELRPHNVAGAAPGLSTLNEMSPSRQDENRDHCIDPRMNDNRPQTYTPMNNGNMMQGFGLKASNNMHHSLAPSNVENRNQSFASRNNYNWPQSFAPQSNSNKPASFTERSTENRPQSFAPRNTENRPQSFAPRNTENRPQSFAPNNNGNRPQPFASNNNSTRPQSFTPRIHENRLQPYAPNNSNRPQSFSSRNNDNRPYNLGQTNKTNTCMTMQPGQSGSCQFFTDAGPTESKSKEAGFSSQRRNFQETSQGDLAREGRQARGPTQDQSLRVLTLSIGSLLNIIRLHTDTLPPALYVFYGIVDSATITDSSTAGKLFSLKDKTGVIPCVFYEIDRVLPRLHRGQWYRAVGSVKPGRDRVQCFSLRPASTGERNVVQQTTSMCSALLNQLMRNVVEM